MTVCKIALLGLGTVGSGVVKSLRINAERWEKHFQKKVEVTGILVRDLKKKRNVEVPSEWLTTDFQGVLSIPNLSVVIEVMGGIEPAKIYIEQSILRGCHVITANKELMAKHGDELISLAERQGVHLLYEASVAGGIPIIGTIRTQLRFNDIDRISGILNGTTNYILTQMTLSHKSYPEALAEAQALGYAETDPTSDVEGWDALYKLIILARCTLGLSIQADQLEPEGISSVQLGELLLAENMGHRLKLIAELEKKQSKVYVQVAPRLVPKGHPLYEVNDVLNAVHLTGNIVGDLAFVGRGAGEYPTASAVLEDLWFITENSGKPKSKGKNTGLTWESKLPKSSNCAPLLCSFPVSAGEGEGTLSILKERLHIGGAVILDSHCLSLPHKDWVGIVASNLSSGLLESLDWKGSVRTFLVTPHQLLMEDQPYTSVAF
jgi:homoserine dehydrogenase